MITIIFACGHTTDVDDPVAPPICACGERRISHVKAPPPRFVGACRGPHATYRELPGIGVPLGAQETKA